MCVSETTVQNFDASKASVCSIVVVLLNEYGVHL